MVSGAGQYGPGQTTSVVVDPMTTMDVYVPVGVAVGSTLEQSGPGQVTVTVEPLGTALKYDGCKVE